MNRRNATQHDQLRELWERMHEHELKREKSIRRASAPEVIAALEFMFAATDDPIFTQATSAVRRHAGKLQFTRQDRRTYLRRIHHLVSRRKIPVRAAAARTAADFFVPGDSFDAVVDKLERAYKKEIRLFGLIVGG
jgi:hypothetical protein